MGQFLAGETISRRTLFVKGSSILLQSAFPDAIIKRDGGMVMDLKEFRVIHSTRIKHLCPLFRYESRRAMAQSAVR
jgi:hypothetical protein